MTDGGHEVVMGPCQRGQVTPRLYNFATDQTEDVNIPELTDAQAVQFIPQHPLAQSAYHLLRAKDASVIEALTDVVMVTLLSGGQRKFIHVRDGGRG
jgi:hypothetical protein